MKRKLIAFSMTMALLLSVFSAANVGAHTVTIETPALTASRADWFGLQGDSSGIGVVQRNASQQGEYIFNDAGKDQRIITTTQPVTRETDLDWFGVTADATNVYFLAKIDQLSGITNSPSLELLITVDTNQQSGSGTTDLPLVQAAGTYSTTKVANDAAWEYAVRTKFSPGAAGARAVQGTTFIYTSPNAAGNGTICTSPGTCSAQLASASVNQGNFAEVKVAWSQIGGKPVNGKYLRLTASTLYSNHAVPADGYNSPVIDVLGTSSTLADLQDGTINTSVDVHFDANGEVYAPLMVTEFQPNPIGTDSPGSTNQSTETEWIEVYNPNSFAIPLSDYKISNTPKRGTTSQGAFKFPNNSTIAGGAVVIVARERSRFLAGHPGFAGIVYDISGNTNSTLNMTQYTAWAGGQLQLDNQPSVAGGTFEEQVLLLDVKDGIVDMATYGNTATPYPGHTPINTSAVPEGVSYERCPALRDTNNSNVDFITRNTPGEQTPGVACVGIPGIDLIVTKTGPSNPVVDEVTQARYVPYTITFRNNGTITETGTVVVSDTLPTGLSFTNTPENASVAPTSVNGQVLTWNITPAGLAAGASGTIELTATVDLSVAPNTPLVNNVTISSPNEQAAAKGNNADSWTTTTEGPADTSVSSNLSGVVPPGAQFQFTITYRNNGQNDASGVTITDVLPAGVTILSEDSPAATWDNATTGTVTWDVGELPVNGVGTIVVTAQLANSATVGTVLSNALSITVPANDPNPTDNTETKTVTVGLRKVYLPLIMR